MEDLQAGHHHGVDGGKQAALPVGIVAAGRGEGGRLQGEGGKGAPNSLRVQCGSTDATVALPAQGHVISLHPTAHPASRDDLPVLVPATSSSTLISSGLTPR